MSKQEPIAIIGIGALVPDANNKEEFWQNIISGKNSITEVPQTVWDSKLFYSPDHFEEGKTYSKIGAFLKDYKFNSIKYRIPPAVGKQLDPAHCYALDVASQALEDSGYLKKDFDRNHTAVIVANSAGGPLNEYSDMRIYEPLIWEAFKKSSVYNSLTPAQSQELVNTTRDELNKFLPLTTEDTMAAQLPNVIAGRIANVFNLKGPSFSVDAACASSLYALACALDGLRSGKFNMALCIGSDAMMGPSQYIKFAKIGALSGDGSRPFDDKANGFVMGEGAGALLLKPLGKAQQDGDKIYALINSVGLSSDGKGKGITAPNPEGQKIAIKNAFDGLDYGPQDISLMEAHGTATKVGDAAEMAALNDFFKDVKTEIALGSVKSQIGHTKANAGMASLIKVALALHNKILPPSINFEEPSKSIDWQNSPFKVNTKARAWDTTKIRRANVSAFGFGGQNAHAALEEYNAQRSYTKTEVKETQQIQNLPTQAEEKMNYQLLVEQEKLLGDMLVFSAPTRQELFDSLNKLSKEITDDEFYLVKNAYKNHTAPRAQFAVAINAESTAKLKSKIAYFLEKAVGGNIWEEQSLYLKMKGIYPFHPTTQKPKVCFMFPGQGAQYVDMMKDLASKYKIVRDTFEEADKVSMKLAGVFLTEVIWSKPGEDKEKLKEREEGIKRTEITQPAILTANVAMMRLLYQFGIKPDVTMGHSLGEYGAAVAAGILSFEDALKAVTMRGSAMAGLNTKDNGKMAAVAAGADKVEPELRKISGYVAVANKNCPTQTVIAGESKSVDDAVTMFNNMGMQAVVIPVSHAFHSAIVRPAAEGYRKFLDTLHFNAPVLPITSNVSADFYPQDIQAIKDTMVEQIMSSVEWIKQVELAYERGVRLFIEVGPKRILSAFVTNTLEGKKDIRVLASNHPKRGGITEFNDLMANLAAAGIEVNWSKTDLEKDETLYNPAFVNAVMPQKAKTVQVPVTTQAVAENITLENVNCTLNLTREQAQNLLQKLQEKLGTVTVASAAAPAVAPVAENKPEVKPEPKPEIKPEPKAEVKPLDEATVTKEVVTLISQKTGYPEDMLELDVDMEAELGIDTVKQAEMFVLLQEKYGITSNTGLALKDYPTIRHCVNYIMSNTSKENNLPKQEKETSSSKEEDPFPKREEPKPVEQKEPEQVKTQAEQAVENPQVENPAEEMPAAQEPEVKEQPETETESASEQAKVEEQPEVKEEPKPEEPKENRSCRFLPALADAPLAEEFTNNLSPKRTVLIFSDNASLTKAYSDVFKMEGLKTHIFTKLKTRGKNVSMISWDSLQETQTALETFAKENQAPVQGIVYLLPCSLKKYDKKQSPTAEFEEYLRPLKSAVKIFEKDLQDKSNANTFLATIFKGGGIPFASKENPTNGAILGTALCLKKELEGLRNKIIAFSEDTTPELMAQKTIFEILKGDDRCLISYEKENRATVFYMPYKFAEGQVNSLEGKTLAFTGAATGLGAKLALKIAERVKARFILMGETEKLENSAYLATLNDEELKAEKAKITQQLKTQNPNITEEEIKQYLNQTDNSIIIYKNQQKLEALGSQSEYVNIDLTNAIKLREIIAKIRNRYGRADALFQLSDLSKTGLESTANIISNFLNFNFVKDGGLYVFNTSPSGKFGDKGQSDILSAEGYLNQIAYTLNTLGYKAVNIASPVFEDGSYLDLILEEILHGNTPEVVLSETAVETDSDNQIRFDSEEQTENIPEGPKTESETEPVTEQTTSAQEMAKEQPQETAEEEPIREEISETFEQAPEQNLQDEAAEEEPVEDSAQTQELPQEEQPAAAEQTAQEEQQIQEEQAPQELFSTEQAETPAQPEETVQPQPEETVQSQAEETPYTGHIKYSFAGGVVQQTDDAVVTEKLLTSEQPFLRDYVYKGTPYLPLSFALEGLGEISKIFNKQQPEGFEKVHLYMPVKLLRQNPINIRFRANKTGQDKPDLEIESDFIGSKGVKVGNTRSHFTAENLNNFSSSWDGVKNNIALTDTLSISQEDTYKDYIQGPALQVLGGIIKVDANSVLALYKEPSDQVIQGYNAASVTAPLFTEAMFQACAYRDYAVEGHATFPEYISKIKFYRQEQAKPQQLYVYAKYNDKTIEGKSSFDAFIFDKDFNLWAEIQNLQTSGSLGF